MSALNYYCLNEQSAYHQGKWRRTPHTAQRRCYGSIFFFWFFFLLLLLLFLDHRHRHHHHHHHHQHDRHHLWWLRRIIKKNKIKIYNHGSVYKCLSRLDSLSPQSIKVCLTVWCCVPKNTWEYLSNEIKIEWLICRRDWINQNSIFFELLYSLLESREIRKKKCDTLLAIQKSNPHSLKITCDQLLTHVLYKFTRHIRRENENLYFYSV